MDRGHRVVREVEIAQIARLRIEDREGRPATTVVRAQDAAVLEETERGHAEDPGGIPELGLRRVQGRAFSVSHPVEVPPAAAIAREDEIARGAPLGLPDRLLPVPACDALGLAQGAVGGQLGDEELASVPGHPREIPGEEAELRAAGRDARRGVEVPTAGDDARLARAVGADRDELVDDVPGPVALVALANADPEGAVRRHATVRVAVALALDFGRDRDRRLSRILAVEALIVEVGEEHCAAVDAERSAPVLVDHRAKVEPRGCDVDGLRARRRLHEDDASALVGASLEEPGCALGEPCAGERRPATGHEVRSDRRRPRAVRRDGLLAELGFQRRRLSYSAVPTRDQAWDTLTRYTKSESLLRHALAVEASVRFYARLYGEDEEFWGCVALLHDFDYEIHPTLDQHPQDGAPILREEGYPEELIEAALSHAEHLNMPRDTQLKKVLFACDELSGFVHACGLVRPTGLEGLEPKSVKKKLKQPSFAAGVHRDEVYEGAELLGLELDEHIANVIAAMQPIAGELGLRTAADAA